jgi:hypothetical protein
MPGNHSVDDHDEELSGNESVNQSWQSAGAAHSCKALKRNTHDDEAIEPKISFVYMILMLMMSNILTYILRSYYREIIF